jgi:hypothetical protein
VSDQFDSGVHEARRPTGVGEVDTYLRDDRVGAGASSNRCDDGIEIVGAPLLGFVMRLEMMQDSARTVGAARAAIA